MKNISNDFFFKIAWYLFQIGWEFLYIKPILEQNQMMQ